MTNREKVASLIDTYEMRVVKLFVDHGMSLERAVSRAGTCEAVMVAVRGRCHVHCETCPLHYGEFWRVSAWLDKEVSKR